MRSAYFHPLFFLVIETILFFYQGTLRDQWTKYEEFYEQLSHWIKDTENSMKADSDLRSSLDQKMEQLNRHKVIFETYSILVNFIQNT